MIELDIHEASLMEEVCDIVKMKDETIEINDKYYISSDTILYYLDQVYRKLIEKQEKIQSLESILNEDNYDRYVEMGWDYEKYNS